VRACRDVRPRFGDAPFRRDGGSLLPPDVPPGLLPVAPSRAADPARLQKTSDVLHSLATGCGQQTVPPVARAGLVPDPPGPPVSVARLTSGRVEDGGRLIDRRHLGCGRSRSSSRKIGGCGPRPRIRPRKRRVRAGPFVRVERLYTGELGRRPRASGSSRARRLLPFAGVGLARWDRPKRCSRTGSAPGNVESPVDAAAIPRREVSERIGLG